MKRALDKLPRQERFNAYVYAYNTLLCELGLGVVQTKLDQYAEEHARNWLRKRRRPQGKERA